MSTNTTEEGLEAHITQYLVEENNYILRENKVYENSNCLDTELFFQFLETTQPKAVAKLKQYHKDLYEQKIIKRLNDQIQAKGIIEVLRKVLIPTKLYTLFRGKLNSYFCEDF